MWDEFYDIKPLPELVAKGADVLLNLNASPFYPGKRHERDATIRRHIHQLRKPLVYINTAGAADNGKNIIPFDGESLVYDASGNLLAIGRQFGEELLVVDVDPGAAPGAPVQLPPLDRDREIYEGLMMALRDYMRKTGFSRAIIARLRRNRFRARAGDCRRRPRPGPGRGVQHAVPLQQRHDQVDRRPARARVGGRLQRHSHPDDRRSRPRGLREARPSDRELVHPREPARENPRAPDDGGIERRGRAPHLLRQRDRDRPRLRHPLRRHVRRHLAHRRPVQARRLPARAVRERQARIGKNPRGGVSDQAVRGAGRRPVRPVRLPRRRADRRRAGRAAEVAGRF